MPTLNRSTTNQNPNTDEAFTATAIPWGETLATPITNIRSMLNGLSELGGKDGDAELVISNRSIDLALKSKEVREMAGALLRVPDDKVSRDHFIRLVETTFDRLKVLVWSDLECGDKIMVRAAHAEPVDITVFADKEQKILWSKPVPFDPEVSQFT